MDQQQSLIDSIVEKLSDVPRLSGLFLAGSFGRDAADEYSDIDLVAVAEAEDHKNLAADWRKKLESIVEVVFWNQRGTTGILLNAVTSEWQRIDLFVITKEDFKRRAQDSLKVLIDRDGFFEDLDPVSSYRQANIGRVTYVIHEFIRVLGLLYVVDGRKEYFTAVTGYGLQRDHLLAILTEENPELDNGGALHLSKSISAEGMEILMSLPSPGPRRSEVIEAQVQIARIFFPRARLLAKKLGIDWPTDFEAATAQILSKHFEGEFEVNWD